MGRRRRVRTDASSTQVNASGTFATTWKWGTAQEVRDYTHLAVFLNPTSLTFVNQVEVVVAWSDDGTTIGFADEDNYQQTDFNLASFTDGSFNPKPYTAFLSFASGTLALNQVSHLVFPIKAGFCRVGVRANSTQGIYTLRTQRLVS